MSTAGRMHLRSQTKLPSLRCAGRWRMWAAGYQSGEDSAAKTYQSVYLTNKRWMCWDSFLWRGCLRVSWLLRKSVGWGKSVQILCTGDEASLPRALRRFKICGSVANEFFNGHFVKGLVEWGSGAFGDRIPLSFKVLWACRNLLFKSVEGLRVVRRNGAANRFKYYRYSLVCRQYS